MFLTHRQHQLCEKTFSPTLSDTSSLNIEADKNKADNNLFCGLRVNKALKTIVTTPCTYTIKQINIHLNTPFSPVYTFFTCALAGSMVTSLSTPEATSAGDPAFSAPETLKHRRHLPWAVNCGLWNYFMYIYHTTFDLGVPKHSAINIIMH